MENLVGSIELSQDLSSNPQLGLLALLANVFLLAGYALSSLSAA